MLNLVSRDWSARLRNASFVFAVFIVMLHTNGPDYNAPRDLIVQFIRNVFPGKLWPCAVPFFFCCSGFFLAPHFDESGWYGRELWKRLKTLFVPYIVINLMGFLLYQLAAIYAHIPCGMTTIEALGLSVKNPAVSPLWYVRNLLLLILVAPVFVPLIKRGFVCTFVVCVFLLVFQCTCEVKGVFAPSVTQALTYLFSINGLAYFLLGASLRSSVRLPIISGKLKVLGAILLVSGWLCVFALCRHWQVIPLFGLLLIPGVVMLLPGDACRIPAILTRNSFPIFIFHTIIFYVFNALLRRIPVNLDWFYGRWWGWGGGVLLAVSASIAIAEWLRKIPLLHRLILGGR